MKLKKIASLMLAGVMAVSMLAGCSGKGNGNDGEPENPVVPTTGVVAYANDSLSADNKEEFSYTASTELDAILKDLASNTSDFSSKVIKGIFDNTNLQWGPAGVVNKLNNKLNGLVDNNFTKAPANGVSDHYGYVYHVSGKLSEKEAVAKIASNFAENYVLSTSDDTQPGGINCPSTVDYNGDTYDCAYSAEISAVKVSNSSASNESAWVVAIVLTQNITKASNTVD